MFNFIFPWSHPVGLAVGALLVVFSAFRLLYLLYITKKGRRKIDFTAKKNVKTVIVIGSGGHTTEVLRLVKHLKSSVFHPRIYIIATSDHTSENKVVEMERCSEADDENWNSNYRIVRIPRSRHVGQSYIMSIFTTLYSTLLTTPKIYLENPDLILCNGPGTCIPVCAIAFLMRLYWLSNNAIVFVESLCRVKSLSLSGKILIHFADEIVVQWPELQKKYPRTKYIGKL